MIFKLNLRDGESRLRTMAVDHSGLADPQRTLGIVTERPVPKTPSASFNWADRLGMRLRPDTPSGLVSQWHGMFVCSRHSKKSPSLFTLHLFTLHLFTHHGNPAN